MSDREGYGRQDPIINEIAKAFGLDTPGVIVGIYELRRMRNWGIEITNSVALRCIKTHVEEARKHQARLDAQDQQRSDDTHDPVVYYMRIGNRVKIGWTASLARRLEAINPEELMTFEPGDAAMEAYRHKQFARYRVHGEWFRLEGDVAEHIRKLANRTDVALVDIDALAVALGKPVEELRGLVRQGVIHPADLRRGMTRGRPRMLFDADEAAEALARRLDTGGPTDLEKR